jgi:CRISPR-associated protein Cas2
MRMSYLVCYDIADEGRLRKVFKVVGYGDHLQFSVFECQLPRELRRSLNGRVSSEPLP